MIHKILYSHKGIKLYYNNIIVANVNCGKMIIIIILFN